jgi:hypothetical protein
MIYRYTLYKSRRIQASAPKKEDTASDD